MMVGKLLSGQYSAEQMKAHLSLSIGGKACDVPNLGYAAPFSTITGEAERTNEPSEAETIDRRGWAGPQ